MTFFHTEGAEDHDLPQARSMRAWIPALGRLSPVRSRVLGRLVALVSVIGLGVASRRVHTGIAVFDKSLGDALYAVMVYLLLAIAFPRRGHRALAVVALAICFALEAFQATGIPSRHADSPIVRWVLGTTFAWHDLACYVVGIAAVLLAEELRSRSGPPSRRERREPPSNQAAKPISRG